jgi:hypothetical protein
MELELLWLLVLMVLVSRHQQMEPSLFVLMVLMSLEFPSFLATMVLLSRHQ